MPSAFQVPTEIGPHPMLCLGPHPMLKLLMDKQKGLEIETSGDDSRALSNFERASF